MRRWLVLGMFWAGCGDLGATGGTESTVPGTDTDEPGPTVEPPTSETTPTGDTGSSTTEPGDGSVQQLCVDEINDYRATLGLQPYARWTSGEACADAAAESDSITGEPHGAFGSCGEFAQNECPGWPGPYERLIEDCLAMMWAEGPGEPFSEHGHFLNMSSTSYSEVACGFHTTPGGSVWAVQNFR